MAEYTLDQIDTAIRNADKAGRKDDVVRLYEHRKSLVSSGQSTNGVIGETVRQVGLAGRALLGGAAQAVEPFTEPVRYLMNKALPGNPIGNIEAATDEVATKIGLPEPQGDVERGVQSVGRFATGFAGGAGIANKAEDVVQGMLGLSKQIKMGVPTSDELKAIATAAYKTADDSGLVVRQDSFGKFVDDLFVSTKEAGIDRTIHPKATAALGRLRESADNGVPLTIKELDTLRRVARGAGKSIEADERRIGSLIVNGIDDYMSRLGTADITSGDPKTAIAALKTARDAWSRMSKSNIVQDEVEKAGIRAGQYTGSGFENALRTQFRQLALSAKRMRGFTAEEQAAIKKIAAGGKIDNAMRMLGKLAPTGVISAAIGSGAGYAIGGRVGAVAAPLGGAVARRVATKRTERNVEELNNLVLGGKTIKNDAPDWLLPWISGSVFGADAD